MSEVTISDLLSSLGSVTTLEGSNGIVVIISGLAKQITFDNLLSSNKINANSLAVESEVTNFPEATKGEVYQVTSEGWLGGVAGSGLYVNIGDLLYCTADVPSGTYTSVDSYWNIYRHVIAQPDGYRYIDSLSNTEAPTGITNGLYWLDNELYKVEDGVATKLVANSGDVLGPAINTDLYVPQWDGANSKTLKNGFQITTAGMALLDDADAAAQRVTLSLDKVPIIVSWPGKPDDAAVISVWPPACTIPANLTGATYHGVIDPAAEAVVTLKKNGTSFGTATVAAGSTDVMTGSSTETAFNGTTDRLDICFPAQDADWSGVAFKFQGVRS